MNRRIELLDLGAWGGAWLPCAFTTLYSTLNCLGWPKPGYSAQPHWKYFARAIATSFLVLVGIGLFLAHFQHSQMARMGHPLWSKICAAAGAYYDCNLFCHTRGSTFSFGISCIRSRFASVIGIVDRSMEQSGYCWRLPVSFFGSGQTIALAALDHPMWFWTGLSAQIPISSDYVPVFPWTAPGDLGHRRCKAGTRFGLASRHWQQLTRKIGWHQLLKFYRAKQPRILFGASTRL